MGDLNSHGQCPTDFLTTIVFTTLSVCGLDYTFTIPFSLGVPRLVSTPSSYDAWLGIAILQVSPNLRNYTHKVSQMRLNFHKSGVSTDSTNLPWWRIYLASEFPLHRHRTSSTSFTPKYYTTKTLPSQPS